MTTNDHTPNLVLGIDTGGTYTDGVLLEYETRRVLAAHKSLTTKRDFAIGIENVIEGIKIADPTAIRMVSISTTLATNAIAEGFNSRIQSIKSSARGFRNFANYRLRILFHCGKLHMLPETCH